MRRRIGWMSVTVLVIMLAVTAAATWATHTTVHHQEDKLLSERAYEVRLVLSTATTSLDDELKTLGGF